MTASRRMRRKAVMRTVSVLEGSDQMLTVVLMRDLRTFLKESRYGSKGTKDESVSLMVGASKRFSKRYWTDEACDFSNGAKVRYFFESVAIRILPVMDSFAGKW